MPLPLNAVLGVPAGSSKHVREAALESGCLALATGLCVWRNSMWFAEVEAQAPGPHDGWIGPYLGTAIYHVPWNLLWPLYALMVLLVWVPGVLGKVIQLPILMGMVWHYAMWATGLIDFWRGNVPQEFWPTLRPTLLDFGTFVLFAAILCRRTVAGVTWCLQRVRASQRKERAA